MVEAMRLVIGSHPQGAAPPPAMGFSTYVYLVEAAAAGNGSAVRRLDEWAAEQGRPHREVG